VTFFPRRERLRSPFSQNPPLLSRYLLLFVRRRGSHFNLERRPKVFDISLHLVPPTPLSLFFSPHTGTLFSTFQSSGRLFPLFPQRETLSSLLSPRNDRGENSISFFPLLSFHLCFLRSVRISTPFLVFDGGSLYFFIHSARLAPHTSLFQSHLPFPCPRLMR